MATKTATPATKAKKVPNMGLIHTQERQLKKMIAKVNYHTNQAESYNEAAEGVKRAIEALAQPQPGLFTEK